MEAAVAILISLAITVFMIAAVWKTYSKAGQPGWGSIIPIYNSLLLLRIAGRPWWWILLLLIPIVDIVILFIVLIDVAKGFSRGAGFGVGLVLLPFIFYPILGFGSARYAGPPSAGDPLATPPDPNAAW
jgi:hypothetical protein